MHSTYALTYMVTILTLYVTCYMLHISGHICNIHLSHKQTYKLHICITYVLYTFHVFLPTWYLYVSCVFTYMKHILHISNICFHIYEMFHNHIGCIYFATYAHMHTYMTHIHVNRICCHTWGLVIFPKLGFRILESVFERSWSVYCQSYPCPRLFSSRCATRF